MSNKNKTNLLKLRCVICKKLILKGKEINQKEKIWKGYSKYGGEKEIARQLGGTYCPKCWKWTKRFKIFFFSLIWSYALFVLGGLLYWFFFSKGS